MTPLGKSIVTIGIGIFTAATLLWIILGNWQWFAGGAAIFLGSLMSSAVISVETKSSSPSPNGPFPNRQTPFPESWSQPNDPPPDQEEKDHDPFSSPR